MCRQAGAARPLGRRDTKIVAVLRGEGDAIQQRSENSEIPAAWSYFADLGIRF